LKLVVVESPAKAKTIEKYLGPGHRVLASFGHVRDLPPKSSGAVQMALLELDLAGRLDRHAGARVSLRG